jgi:hypothetical protein
VREGEGERGEGERRKGKGERGILDDFKGAIREQFVVGSGSVQSHIFIKKRSGKCSSISNGTFHETLSPFAFPPSPSA